MRRNRKWKISHTVLERWTMCFSSYKNCGLKMQMWWVGAHKIKKSAFFATFIFYEGIFFNIWVLSQCTFYSLKLSEYIYITFTYRKTLLHTFLLLVFKIVKSLLCILNFYYIQTSVLNISEILQLYIAWKSGFTSTLLKRQVFPSKAFSGIYWEIYWHVTNVIGCNPRNMFCLLKWNKESIDTVSDKLKY